MMIVAQGRGGRVPRGRGRSRERGRGGAAQDPRGAGNQNATAHRRPQREGSTAGPPPRRQDDHLLRAGRAPGQQRGQHIHVGPPRLRHPTAQIQPPPGTRLSLSSGQRDAVARNRPLPISFSFSLLFFFFSSTRSPADATISSASTRSIVPINYFNSSRRIQVQLEA